MNTLSKKDRSLILLIVSTMIAITVVSGFAIVWMQQQIARTAEKSQEAEIRLAEIVRKLGYLDEQIATVHQPTMLQARVAATLRPSLESQMVWVQENATRTRRTYTTLTPYSEAELAYIRLNKRGR